MSLDINRPPKSLPGRAVCKNPPRPRPHAEISKCGDPTRRGSPHFALSRALKREPISPPKARLCADLRLADIDAPRPGFRR